MIQELIALGKQVGADLEGFVQTKAKGRLYLLDLHPEEKRARLVAYDLDEAKSRAFLWVGDPPASGAPRDRATTSRLSYLLGQVPTEMAKDEDLRTLLAPLLWEVRKRGKVRYLLDLRGFRLERARPASQGAIRLDSGRLEIDEKKCEEEHKDAGKLAEALADFLEEVWDIEKKKGQQVLYSLALRGKPLVQEEVYRRYLLRRLLEDRFQGAWEGLCHGCGGKGKVISDSTAFRLKFFITDKKSFAPGIREEGFRRAYALCRDCFAALGAGERFALDRLTLRFLESEVLVIPQPGFTPKELSRLVEQTLAEVRGLERLEAWREFLERSGSRREEVAYLGFSLLFFRRSNAATKVQEAVWEVPPSRVEILLEAMEMEGVEGFWEWLYLLPLSQARGGLEVGPVLQAVAQIFLGLPFSPKDLLPLWLKAAERAFREDPTLYASRRYRGGQGALDLVALGARWVRVLRRLDLWRANGCFPGRGTTGCFPGRGTTGGDMAAFRREDGGEIPSAFLEEEERRVFAEYGFGPLEAGLYLLGQAMEAVGHAQAKLYEYRKEPLLESIGWQGMSLVRVRHLVPEVMGRATHYLEEERTRVLDLLGRAQDLLERSRGEGVSEREVPYYILMGYAQARSRRLRSGRRAASPQEEVAASPEGEQLAASPEGEQLEEPHAS